MTHEELEEKLNTAEEQKNTGKYEEAERLCKEVLSALEDGHSHLLQERNLRAFALRLLADSVRRLGRATDALSIAEEALSLAIQADEKSHAAKTMNIIGLAYWNLSDYPRALEHYQKALATSEEIGSKDSIASILVNIGNVYLYLGDYSHALEYFQKALTDNEEIGNKENFAVIFGNIGIVYKTLYDYPHALEYFQKAIAINEEIGSDVGIAFNFTNIGIVYGYIADHARALEYFQKALAIFEKIGNKEGIAKNLGNIGIIFWNLSDYPLAMEYMQKALVIAEEIGSKDNVALNLGNIGLLYGNAEFEGYDLAKAEERLLKAIALCEEIGEKKKLYWIHQSLAEMYETAGRDSDAYRHFKKFYALEKEVQSEDAKKQADKLAFERKIADQEKQIAIEQTRNEEIMRHQHILEEQAAAIHLANTELHVKNIELNSANLLLEEANTFKMKILGIASHDLKNPITGLNLLVHMLWSHISAKPEAVILLEKVSASSKRMLDIVVNLIDVAARELGQIKLSRTSIDVAALTATVVSEYMAHAAKKHQTIEFTFDGDCEASVDTERLRQVLDNLISNAVKYSELGKEIRISVTRKDANIQIAVADKGQGLSSEDMQLLFKDFQKLSARPTGGEGSTGLGLSVVKHLIELHGGTVWAESAGKGHGCTFYVELPALKKSDQ